MFVGICGGYCVIRFRGLMFVIGIAGWLLACFDLGFDLVLRCLFVRRVIVVRLIVFWRVWNLDFVFEILVVVLVRGCCV